MRDDQRFALVLLGGLVLVSAGIRPRKREVPPGYIVVSALTA